MRKFAFLLIFNVFFFNSFAELSQKLYLSGTGLYHEKEWKFRCDGGMNSGKWKKIKVPSQWEIQGFGEYTYGRWYKAGLEKPSTEKGFYEYSFKVPSNWKDKQISIVFEGVMTDAEVKINGALAGDIHQGAFYRFSYDITDKLKTGKSNLLEVKVSKHSDNKSVNAAERRADWWLFGGIYRPVYLLASPKIHIERIAVDAGADGSLKADIFTSPLPKGYSIIATIDPVSDELEEYAAFSYNAVEGKTMHRLSTSWSGIKQWTPENPNLYKLTLKLKNASSQLVHEYTERIGFRTIEFIPRDGIYMNGTKIVMKGINRHSFHPDGGRCTNRSISLQDVKLIKEMNINAVRFHYPPDKHFLEICDSLGLFVVNELAGWQNSYDTPTGKKLVREMVIRDVNHPCIVLWSNGNEGGWNEALDKDFSLYDPQQRHVIHPWADFDELDTHHYPAYQTGIARLSNGPKVFMPAEFMHGMYDQGHGAGLEDFWTKYVKSPLFAGAFMWDFSDNAVKRVDKGGKLDSEMYNAADGIVGPYREKEGSFFTVRELWSPIKIKPFMITPNFKGDIYVTNEYLFNTLENCKLRYRILKIATPLTGASFTVVSEGEITLPAVNPGETARVNLPVTGFLKNADVLEVIAVDYNNAEVCTTTYPAKTATVYTSEKLGMVEKLAKTELIKQDNILSLIAATTKISFDLSTGYILNVENSKSKISLNNGPVAVGMKTKFNKAVYRQEGEIAVVTFSYFGGIDSIRWEMHPGGMLKMNAVMLTRTVFGGGFDDSFMDENISNFGLTFSYDEKLVNGMKWFGRGPYRVWKNRIPGTNYNVWDKAYNNTITGESFENLIYPEFKGYHANLYWATIRNKESDFSVYSASENLFFRVLTPEEPKFRQDGINTMPAFPEGDLSFLYEIPAIRDFKPIHQHGPQSQPGSIRIKKGDEGVKMELWFDFNVR